MKKENGFDEVFEDLALSLGLKRKFTGYWIPESIHFDRNLKALEKDFLVEINSLDNEKGCWASNEYFAKFFDVSKSRASQIIRKLVNDGYIDRTYIYKKGTKEVEKRILKISNTAKPHFSKVV